LLIYPAYVFVMNGVIVGTKFACENGFGHAKLEEAE
jgi:hypothetical protein